MVCYLAGPSTLESAFYKVTTKSNSKAPVTSNDDATAVLQLCVVGAKYA